MRPQVTSSITSVAASAPVVMDRKQNPFNVSFVVVVNGTLTYTVEHTLDDILSGVTPTWLPHSSVAADTTTQDGNYAFPVTAIRLNVTAYTSGSAVMTVLQWSSQ